MGKQDIINLFSELTLAGFSYNARNGISISRELEISIKTLLDFVPLSEIEEQILFRARSVNLQTDVNTGKGIRYEGGKLVGGFNEENSGPPPARIVDEKGNAKECDAGRFNQRGESVFYVAGSKFTAAKEVQNSDYEYVSIARFMPLKPRKIMDFSVISPEDLERIFPAEMMNNYMEKYELNPKLLFKGAQDVETNSAFRDQDYIVSNALKKIICTYQVDGIRYLSSHGGNNLCFWDYNKNLFRFVDSQVYAFSDIFMSKQKK